MNRRLTNDKTHGRITCQTGNHMTDMDHDMKKTKCDAFIEWTDQISLHISNHTSLISNHVRKVELGKPDVKRYRLSRHDKKRLRLGRHDVEA